LIDGKLQSVCPTQNYFPLQNPHVKPGVMM
jgi:hypothetical protein